MPWSKHDYDEKQAAARRRWAGATGIDLDQPRKKPGRSRRRQPAAGQRSKNGSQARKRQDGTIEFGTSYKLRRRILDRDQGRCRYCGDPATQIDHILPFWWGGHNGENNLVASCKPCNTAKGARLDCPQIRTLAAEGNKMAQKAIGLARHNGTRRPARPDPDKLRIRQHPIFATKEGAG